MTLMASEASFRGSAEREKALKEGEVIVSVNREHIEPLREIVVHTWSDSLTREAWTVSTRLFREAVVSGYDRIGQVIV